MTATVHVLHPQSVPLSGFLRIGHTGHRKLEALLAAGRFRYKRVVFDAAHLVEQNDLLKALKASSCEIVLDPNFAEMAAIGRFGSAISRLPWANSERPWQAADFKHGRNLDTAKAVAEFAVQHGANAVLTPSHLIESANDAWRSIDLNMCEALRYELDQVGGNEIGIDYQLISTNALLKDGEARQALIANLDQLPIDNLWLRISGFGASATGVGTRHFVESVRALHQLNLPLVADSVGGFPALAALAFGAVGGISHGVGQKENFRASEWKSPPSGGGGSTPRIYLHEFDRYFTEDQLNSIFSAKGGKSRFCCNDTSCCKHGQEDMIENAHSHFITQRTRQLDDLSGVPEARRAEHFMLRHLDPAIRSMRYGAKLKIADEKVAKNINDAKSRLVRLRDALADLVATEDNATRSRAPIFRGQTSAISAVLGR